MDARAAWSWLQERPAHGLRCHGLHVYMPASGIVEVSHPGSNDSHDLTEPEFLDRFADATFYPLDTADVAA